MLFQAMEEKCHWKSDSKVKEALSIIQRRLASLVINQLLALGTHNRLQLIQTFIYQRTINLKASLKDVLIFPYHRLPKTKELPWK